MTLHAILIVYFVVWFVGAVVLARIAYRNNEDMTRRDALCLGTIVAGLWPACVLCGLFALFARIILPDRPVR